MTVSLSDDPDSASFESLPYSRDGSDDFTLLRTMNEPIHSRGTGRSGPKRKTGCLTCRRRKVRCDESRPVCANCIRLRLDCDYIRGKARSRPIPSPNRATPSTPARRTLSVTSRGSLTGPQPLSTINQTIQAAPQIAMSNYEPQSNQWTVASEPPGTFDASFSDTYFPSLEAFDVGVGYSVASDGFMAPTYYPDPTNGMAKTQGTNGPVSEFSGMGEATDDDARRQVLLERFADSVNPTLLIQPTKAEWTSMCRNLLVMASESASLRSAMCSLSALYLYTVFGEESFDESVRYYRSASREASDVMNSTEVSERQLKHTFATLFLLTYIEILAQTTAKGKRNGWPLQHLQSFHHRVRQHNERIREWRGLNKRLLTWTTLLQTKVEWNSGDIALQYCSTALSEMIGNPFARRPNTTTKRSNHRTGYTVDSGNVDDHSSVDDEQDDRSMCEIAWDTINQPSVDFFLRSQAFTSRILALGRYNDAHEDLEMDIERLKEGQQINTDLQALWATRPSTINMLNSPHELDVALQPHMARQVILHLRVYVANFFAQLIHLHRVAFHAYPATTDVNTAAARIIGLTKEILDSLPPRGRSQEQSPATSLSSSATDGTTSLAQDIQSSCGDGNLPAMMLWPLFLAASECNISDRAWILQVLKEANKRSCSNVTRTVYLLEELLRRQDQEGRRVDHRRVRKDIFDGELSAIF